ncbi:hypothetical protein AGMMS49991_07780 [Spirochaetia bacterium]|nr:hypothetical protein AGMMS49991_07780 [Spirochaetia bacterium]
MSPESAVFLKSYSRFSYDLTHIVSELNLLINMAFVRLSFSVPEASNLQPFVDRINEHLDSLSAQLVSMERLDLKALEGVVSDHFSYYDGITVDVNNALASLAYLLEIIWAKPVAHSDESDIVQIVSGRCQEAMNRIIPLISEYNDSHEDPLPNVCTF